MFVYSACMDFCVALKEIFLSALCSPGGGCGFPGKVKVDVIKFLANYSLQCNVSQQQLVDRQQVELGGNN